MDADNQTPHSKSVRSVSRSAVKTMENGGGNKVDKVVRGLMLRGSGLRIKARRFVRQLGCVGAMCQRE